MTEDRQIVAVNYWKDIRKNLRQELNHIGDFLFFIHNSAEFPQIIDFLNELPQANSIVYISLTKTYESMKTYFDKIKAKMYVVDCVSGGLFQKESTSDCVFLPAPSHIEGMMDLIKASVEDIKPSFIVLDSISLFIDFASETQSNDGYHRFFRDLGSASELSFIKKILFYDSNLSKQFQKLPQLYNGTIMEMDIVKEHANWKG